MYSDNENAPNTEDPNITSNFKQARDLIDEPTDIQDYDSHDGHDELPTYYDESPAEINETEPEP